MAINLTPYALMFTIAAVGISETAYLIRKRHAAEAPVCPVGVGCETVLTSKYNNLFGLHNDVAGLFFYTFFTCLAAFLVIGLGPVDWWQRLAYLGLAVATVMSLIFTYLQWRVIKAWCFWCLMSAVTVGLMDLVALWIFWQ